MENFPLKSICLSQAMSFQFRFVDEITKVFKGHEMLSSGDLGVVQGLNKPRTTLQAEQVIANFFHGERAMFVRGAGTAAIRNALFSILRTNETLLVHSAPIYNTTAISIEMLGLKIVEANFNDLSEIQKVMNEHPEIKGALVQYTRQSIDDRYDMEEVIETIKGCRNIPIVTDDNYAAMKVDKIGIECGADLSCFSCFKLLGPEGIGCIVGKANLINPLIKQNYSGGSQTQGFEALEALRGLVYAPVSLAIQAQVGEECMKRLLANEIEEVKTAFLANAQSKVLLVELKENIAEAVIKEAELLGAAPNPIGAESKYEIVPMFYRVSGTFREKDPTLEKRMIRINPMRSGADTILYILKTAIEKVKECS